MTKKNCLIVGLIVLMVGVMAVEGNKYVTEADYQDSFILEPKEQKIYPLVHQPLLERYTDGYIDHDHLVEIKLRVNPADQDEILVPPNITIYSKQFTAAGTFLKLRFNSENDTFYQYQFSTREYQDYLNLEWHYCPVSEFASLLTNPSNFSLQINYQMNYLRWAIDWNCCGWVYKPFWYYWPDWACVLVIIGGVITIPIIAFGLSFIFSIDCFQKIYRKLKEKKKK